jgi:hypothetical protein
VPAAADDLLAEDVFSLPPLPAAGFAAKKDDMER